MNLKELHIINSVIEQALIKYELEGLKERLLSSENYTVFLEKLLNIIINKDTTVGLNDFLTTNGLSNKVLSIQNKTTDIIEELAELHYKGLSSDITQFLIKENNQLFLNHLAFLKETENSFLMKERIDLKKMVEKLGKLGEFNLEENEIQSAIILAERKRLKERFIKLEPKNNKSAKIIDFNFKAVLKYAAIIILVISPSIFIINRINQKNTKQQIAIKEIKKIIDSTKNKKAPYNFQLPKSEIVNDTYDLISEKTYGFSSNDDKKVSIEISNLKEQLNSLKIELQNHQSDSNTVNYLNHSIDSLNSINETYTFNVKESKIFIYTSKLSADKKTLSHIKPIVLKNDTNKMVYLKIKNNYFKLISTGKYHKLKIELNEVVIDQLDIITKQNE